MAEAETNSGTPADRPNGDPATAADGSHHVAKKAGLAGVGLATLWLLGVLFRRRKQ